jgi:hypothetical protein
MNTHAMFIRHYELVQVMTLSSLLSKRFTLPGRGAYMQLPVLYPSMTFHTGARHLLPQWQCSRGSTKGKGGILAHYSQSPSCMLTPLVRKQIHMRGARPSFFFFPSLASFGFTWRISCDFLIFFFKLFFSTFAFSPPFFVSLLSLYLVADPQSQP